MAELDPKGLKKVLGQKFELTFNPEHYDAFKRQKLGNAGFLAGTLRTKKLLKTVFMVGAKNDR